jgi:hypothetical protein
MSSKKSKRNKIKEDINPRHSKYEGPYQSNQFAKIDAQKHLMEITGHSPTKDTFTPLSESDDYIPSDEELSKQILTDRHSPTETKKTILKVGLKVMYGILIAGILTAIGFFYSHELRISRSENDIGTLKNEVKDNTKDINDLKTDKKLYDYQLKELQEKKKK